MAASAQELIKSAESALEQYLSVLDSGEIPDMKGFDSKIKNICDVVDKLSQKDADKYSKSLTALNSSLATLAKRLEAKKEEIGGKIGGLDYNKKAQIAYRTADSLKPKKA